MSKQSNIFSYNGIARRKVLALAGLTFIAAGWGCTSQRYVKMAKKQTVVVVPNPLEVHGGKAIADVTISMPADVTKGKYGVATELIFSYPDDKKEIAQLERIPFVPGQYIRTKEKLTAQKMITVPWEPGQEKGILKARAVLNEKRDFIYLPYQSVAQGFITTYQLAVPEEPIGFIASPYTRETEENQYVFYFNNNSAGLKSYVGADSGPLADFISLNHTSKHVKITAYQSPDEKSSLAKERAEAVKRFYIQQVDRHTYKGESGKIKFETSVVSQDTKPLIAAISASPMPEDNKEEVLKVLQGKGSYASKNQKLKKLKSYKYLQNYIFPQLRKVDMEAIFERQQKMNFEIGLTADRIAKGEVDSDILTADEFAYAAELTPLMNEKERLIKAAVRIHKRPQDYYNLGVLYLKKAEKEKNQQYKKEYYEAAAQSFKNAAGTFNTPKVYYNLAMAHQLSGNTNEANQYYDVTTRLQGGEEFTQKVISARAAMLVKAGKYDEAAQVLQNAGEGYSANISRGLIAIYNQDYTSAAAAFTQAATANPASGLPHYLLAVTGARSANEELVYSGLQTAVSKDRSFVEKAIDDLEFRDYKQNRDFARAIK